MMDNWTYHIQIYQFRGHNLAAKPLCICIHLHLITLTEKKIENSLLGVPVIIIFLPLFSQLAAEYSECPSGKKGGDLGWFPRGKMAGPFQDVAFSTVIGATSAPFKSTYGFKFGWFLCSLS